jgi:hypothetical protein
VGILTNKAMRFNQTRRKFMASGMLALGILAILKKIWPAKKRVPETTKLLARDGTLVELPLAKLPKKKTAITKEGLVSWIWKDQKI